MPFNPEIAATRFGTGLSPRFMPPQSLDAVFAELAAPDQLAVDFPVSSFENMRPTIIKYRKLNKISKISRDKDTALDARKQTRNIRQSLTLSQVKWFNANLARYIAAPHGFRERLVRFWANHFTVVGKDQFYRELASPYVEEAIRPNISGSFADLLKAATMHPMMIQYLDQGASVGPNSPHAKKKRKKGLGLNENLAREILELHSLGVNGAYSQIDVRQFAELLAGVIFSFEKGRQFLPMRAEPGTEEVLGKIYSGPRAKMDAIFQALDDIASHPDTAAHIARKLCVHFISDHPDKALVDHVRAAYLASDGELMACYRALLTHPSSWGVTQEKIKQPFDYIATSLRALDVDAHEVSGLDAKLTNPSLLSPLTLMGQPWEKANGPDGWPEDAEKWITPQGMAARIQWAMMVPQVLAKSDIDPANLARNALGNSLSPSVLFAAQSAETKWEGVGIVFASPEFQRR